ncbi:MAG: hypothetical protein ACHQ2Z_00020 [Elusimicrobiota bacterium]
MGLDASLEDEFGEELDSFADEDGRLAAAWPAVNPAYPLLRHVDAEGTTLFNRRQLAAALPEFEAFVLAAPPELKAAAVRLLRFARKGAAEPHLYLRFLGD